MIRRVGEDKLSRTSSTVDSFQPTSPSSKPAVTSPTDALLGGVECQLDNKELWHKFHALGTEMIITKSGR